ncbi:MAG: alpha/beta fold hydrolase, partial [Candidatus Rokuibacteriota bacterium]
MLLIHGSGMSAGCWVHQLHGLAPHARMVAIDLPGHGGSARIEGTSVEEYADVVGAFLDTHDARDVIVVGHSLGGAVAIALAARRPPRVTGLVLLSTCARLPHVSAVWEGWLACLPRSVRSALFLSLAKRTLFGPYATGQAVSLGLEQLRACRSDTMVRDIQSARAMDVTGQAMRVDVPALILCGSRDEVTPPALAQALHELIPGSRLSVIDGAGHMVPLEMPEAVNRALLDFAGVAAAPAARAWHAVSIVQRLFAWLARSRLI